MKPSYKKMVEAMIKRDASYDGRYYVGVHSTRIYCLPSCKAKKPYLKNVVFYPTREEAIAAGLRGCKRCKSEKYPDVLPSWLHLVLKFMRENQTERLNENRLIKIIINFDISFQVSKQSSVSMETCSSSCSNCSTAATASVVIAVPRHSMPSR